MTLPEACTFELLENRSIRSKVGRRRRCKLPVQACSAGPHSSCQRSRRERLADRRRATEVAAFRGRGSRRLVATCGISPRSVVERCAAKIDSAVSHFFRLSSARKRYGGTHASLASGPWSRPAVGVAYRRGRNSTRAPIAGRRTASALAGPAAQAPQWACVSGREQPSFDATRRHGEC